jgi:acetoin utilization protein AcuB
VVRNCDASRIKALATFLLLLSNMKALPIEQFMTRSPHTIGLDQTLIRAHGMMREHKVRHLPVLDGGKLVGLVSQRDLEFIESLKDVDPYEVEVSEAMTQDAYTVSPSDDLREVATKMAHHKYGSVVVMKGDDVVGVFTTVDALRALAEVLQTSN